MNDGMKTDDDRTDRKPYGDDRVAMMLHIVKAMDRPRYVVSHDPMDLLTDHGIIPVENGDSVSKFIRACEETGNLQLASAMSDLADFMRYIDMLIGEGGTRPLDWYNHDDWILETTGTGLKAAFERFKGNDDGLPVDFVASDLLSGVTCRPYRWKPYDPDTAPRQPPSCFMVRMDSRTDYSTRGSEYRILIHWES